MNIPDKIDQITSATSTALAFLDSRIDAFSNQLRSLGGSAQTTYAVETVTADTIIQPGKIYRLVVDSSNSLSLYGGFALLHTLHFANLTDPMMEAAPSTVYVSEDHFGFSDEGIAILSFGSAYSKQELGGYGLMEPLRPTCIYRADIEWRQGVACVTGWKPCGIDYAKYTLLDDIEIESGVWIKFNFSEGYSASGYYNLLSDIQTEDSYALPLFLHVKDQTSGQEAYVPIVPPPEEEWCVMMNMFPYTADASMPVYYVNLRLETDENPGYVGVLINARDNSDAGETHTLSFYLESGGIVYQSLEDISLEVNPQFCFPAGSPVMVSLDGATKNIEDIKKGDNVVSYNVETGEKYLTDVQANRKRTATKMARLHLADGTELVQQESHRIYTSDGWASLTKHGGTKELCVGMNVMTASGWSELTAVDRWTERKPLAVYTLALKDASERIDDDTNDNFFVHGVMVHNAK